MQGTLRYEKIRDWMKRSAVSERELATLDFSSEEIQFIVGFDRRTLGFEDYEIAEYFQGVK